MEKRKGDWIGERRKKTPDKSIKGRGPVRRMKFKGATKSTKRGKYSRGLFGEGDAGYCQNRIERKTLWLTGVTWEERDSRGRKFRKKAGPT